jgi:CheY-like chemotaxis protein
VRVLVVDDNHTNRRILEGTLRSWAMRPTAAGKRAEALAAMAAAPRRTVPAHPARRQHAGMDGFTFAERLRAMTESPWPTIMMLSSAGQRGNAARCRALGIKAYLLKPLKRSELLEAIVATLSASAPEPPRERLEPRDTMKHGHGSLHILLAEDNVINQRLAARLWRRRGHDVTIAGDGQQAMDAWSRAEASTPFDLILMDVQMPVQDGFQTTAAIRQPRRAVAGTSRSWP